MVIPPIMRVCATSNGEQRVQVLIPVVQRLGNTSLVEFLWFHSFSLVVKLPEFVRVHITIFLICCNVKLAQSTEARSFFRRSWIRTRSGFLCFDVCVTHVVCFLSSKTNNVGKDFHPKLTNMTFLMGLCCALGASRTRTRREPNAEPFTWQSNVDTTRLSGTRQLLYDFDETRIYIWSLMGFLPR